MSDITCSKCGEPWDGRDVQDAARSSEHVGDLTHDEARRFLTGDGCPSCSFGEACPSCNGTGKESDTYRGGTCCRDGRALVWSPGRSMPGPKPSNVGEPVRELGYTGCEAGRWYIGYVPRVQLVTNPRNLKQIRSYQTRDGQCTEAWITCPHCKGEGDHLDTCRRCNGSGKLENDADTRERLELDAARSHCHASDEEPIGIMNRRGL